MESQPQNPEFRNNPENFRPCIHKDCHDERARNFLLVDLLTLLL